MPSRLAVVGAVLALTLGWGAGPSFGVPAGVTTQADERGLGIRLVDAPVDRKDDPRATVSVVDHVAPGATVTRRYEVTNDTDRALSIRSYVGSADIDDGQFVGQPDAGSGDLTRWSTVSPELLPIQPRQKAIGTVTIDVPADAAPGERYGVIWAETPRLEGAGIQPVNRIGIRVYLSVGEGNEPASDFVVDSLQAAREGTVPVVRATVRNTGGRALDMSGELALSEGPGSLSAGPFAAQLGTTLAPGDSAPVRVALDEALPDGPWLATLTLKSGLLERTARATLTFPEEGEAAPVEAELVEDGGPLWPWIALGLSLLLALGALLARRLKRRDRRDEERETAVAVTPPD